MKKNLLKIFDAKHSGKTAKSKNRAVLSKSFLVLFFVLLSIGLINGSGYFFQISGLKTSAANPTPTPAVKGKKGDGKTINPQAVKQIEALKQEKESRTPAQKKINSNLLHAVKMERGEALAQGVTTIKTGIKTDEKGYVEVQIIVRSNDVLLEELKKIGAEKVVAFPQYNSVTARVPLSAIESLAQIEEVVSIQPKQKAKTNRENPSPVNQPKKSPVINQFLGDSTQNGLERIFQSVKSNNVQTPTKNFPTVVSTNPTTLRVGSVTSEADKTHRADLARLLTGLDGTGVKIGVLSDSASAESIAASQASGNLPPNVTVLPGQDGGSRSDEGTAMLELIHDLAPGAQLYFATAFDGIEQFAQNIKDLRAAGCDIIVDDVTYFVETPFQNGQAPNVISETNAGVVIEAVNDVTVGSQAGALYFSSATNNGNKNDGTAGVWEGDFVAGGPSADPLPAGLTLHDFGGGVLSNSLTEPNGFFFLPDLYLKWSDPLGGSANDYDLFALSEDGTTVVAVSNDIQDGTQDPIESIPPGELNQPIIIAKNQGAADRFLHFNSIGGRLAVSTPGTIYGHNGGLNTISLAATPAGPVVDFGGPEGPFPNAFNSTNLVEIFSSDGPRRIFYNADGTPITPGNASSTGGQLLQKPDITAADGTSTSVPGFETFFGTSAAAPHAAALMALLKNARPGATRTQLINAMKSSAIDIEAAGTDRDSGAGIFMPLPALRALGYSGPAYLDIVSKDLAITEVLGNGNGRLEPGETGEVKAVLENLGLANATNISATLSSNTPGVRFVQPRSRYPNLRAINGKAGNTSPFYFILDSTYECGSTINFTLTVNYRGGQTASQTFNFSVETIGTETISATFSTNAPPSTPKYTTAAGTQSGILSGEIDAGTCQTPKANPGRVSPTSNYKYQSYTFTAPRSGCVTVNLLQEGDFVELSSAAYGNSGFIPSDPAANYLADGSFRKGEYSFNVNAGEQFTIVVYYQFRNSDPDSADYQLVLRGSPVTTCNEGQATISGKVTTNSGAGIPLASVSIRNQAGSLSRGSSTGSDGSYSFPLLPIGQNYTLTAAKNGYQFTPVTVNLTGELTNVNIVAQP